MKKIGLSIFILFMITGLLFAQEHIIFPRAFAFAVDDLGWNIGNDKGDIDGQGPYRIGIDRKMDLDDYRPIVEVGKAVGVRVQCLFVMAEMDRLNILKAHPSTTWQGSNWDNSKNICQEQIDIMNYVIKNAAYMEFGLHGVGHEFWDKDGNKNRAEWYSTDDNKPRNEDTMRVHIQCFKDIMAQYGLTKENGQRFPESFVPCAYAYYWNPKGKYSTGKLMAENGVKYVNTLFTYIQELHPPKKNNGGGFDNGVLVINRINYGNEWWRMAALPTTPLEKQETDIIETHWSNWLAQDNFLQVQTINDFVNYYQMVQKSQRRYCAKNTEQLFAQWLYKKYTKVINVKRGKVDIDNSKMPNAAYKNNIISGMVLKIALNEGEHISEALLNGKQIPAYFEQYGWGYLYLPTLQQQKYTLKYKVDTNQMPFYVYNDGTYNVYDIVKDKNQITIDIKMYGTQTVKIKCPKPLKAISVNKNIKIISEKYDKETMLLTLNIYGKDIQGERGLLYLKY